MNTNRLVQNQDANIKDVRHLAQETSCFKPKSLNIQRSQLFSQCISRKRSFSYPYYGILIKENFFNSFLKRHEIRIQQSQDVQIDQNISFQNQNQNQSEPIEEFVGGNQNQTIQRVQSQDIIIAQENLQIRIQKSSCENVVLTSSQLKNRLQSSEKISKLKTSKYNALKQSQLSQKQKSRDYSEKAFGSCCMSMYDQKSQLFKEQPNVITLSALQQQNPQKVPLPLVQDIGHDVIIYVDRNNNKNQQKEIEPNIFKRIKLFTSQKVKFSEVIELDFPSSIIIGNILEELDLTIKSQYKLHDENLQENLLDGKSISQKLKDKQLNFEAQSKTPNSSHPPVIDALMIDSYPTQNQPISKKQSQLIFGKQNIVENQGLQLPNDMKQYSSCHQCQRKKCIIQQYWQRLRYHTKKQIQLNEIIKSLTIQNQNLQLFYDDKCKKFSQKQIQIGEILKLMDERRTQRDNEVAYLNEEALKRQIDAINNHEKIMFHIISTNSVLQEAYKNNIIRIMKEQHLENVNRHIQEQTILKREIQIYSKKRDLFIKQLQIIYNKTAQILQRYKQINQSQNNQIIFLKDEISQLQKVNQQYLSQIQKLKNEAHKCKTQTFQMEKGYIRIFQNLRNEMKIKSSRIRELENIYHQ